MGAFSCGMELNEVEQNILYMYVYHGLNIKISKYLMETSLPPDLKETSFQDLIRIDNHLN